MIKNQSFKEHAVDMLKSMLWAAFITVVLIVGLIVEASL